MKFIWKSYFLYTKDTHQIWCRSAKFLWKSKFCSGSGSGSRSWFYFGFQYQTYISYIEDTHQILFSIRWLLRKLLCPQRKSTYVRVVRQTDRRTDFFCSFRLFRHTKHEHSSKGENFLFHSCVYNTFSFYILRMWWGRKNPTRTEKELAHALGVTQQAISHRFSYGKMYMGHSTGDLQLKNFFTWNIF